MDERTADLPSEDSQPGARDNSSAGRKYFMKRKDHVPLGIGYMVLATSLFAAASAMTKWLVGIYPVGEVVFAAVRSFLICAAVVPITGFSVISRPTARSSARGISQSISQTLFALAFTLMPLAGAVSINFSAPLFSALISIVWLKERATVARWSVL